MDKKKTSILSFLILLGLIYYSFNSQMPSYITNSEISELDFSTDRALVQLKQISKKPHYVGSNENKIVRQYIINSLKQLGLSPEIQKGYILNERSGSMSKPINIIAKIEGSENGKSLLVFSHYDSALPSSMGASDAGSGVVTILESVRAYLAGGKQPKNDIIILFTDAEEIGLDGAKLFVRSHPLAKNVGIALNFEARGSAGPSSMIVETNYGNKNLIKSFIKANPDFPIASSLLYSIYKMLPNDTDSTILREEGDIDGLFFAFIGNHFDYHTAGDNINRIDKNSLKHQGSYLMSLLNYFADADLSLVKSEEDYVYTNFPILKMISYPFSWVMPLTWLSVFLFSVFICIGFFKNKLTFLEIFKGFIPFLLSIVFAFILGYFGWSIILRIYPHYQEILQGFTYNGYTYIAFFVSISLSFTWYMYSIFQKQITPANLMVAPITLWLIINILIAVNLKGGSYFIIPMYFVLISFLIHIINKENSYLIIHLLLSAPAIFIFSPLIETFPVGLGLKIIFVSTIFSVLVFGLLLSFISSYNSKKVLAQVFFIIGILFFIKAHLNNDFNQEQKKPNSLLYFQDIENKKSYWLTYDKVLDDWSKSFLGENPKNASSISLIPVRSKYKTQYSFGTIAPNESVPYLKPIVLKDSISENKRKVDFKLSPNKKSDVIQLYVDKETIFNSLAFNGVSIKNKLSYNKLNNRLLTYYVSESDSLEVSYETTINYNPTFTILEYSFDLSDNPWVKIKKRPEVMMPKPFVFNDAIIIKQRISP